MPSSKGGHDKFKTPPDILTVESRLKKMKLTDEQLNELYMTLIDNEMVNAPTPEEKMAWADIKVKRKTKVMIKRLEEAFIEDFHLWLLGRSPYNIVEKQVQTVIPDHLGRMHMGYTTTKYTPWGNKQLTFLPGVDKLLDGPVTNRDHVIKVLTKLKITGPRNIDEAWIYYKYLVRKVGIDGDVVNEQNLFSDYDYLNREVPYDPYDPADPDGPPFWDVYSDPAYQPAGGNTNHPNPPPFEPVLYQKCRVFALRNALQGNAFMYRSMQFKNLSPEDKIFVMMFYRDAFKNRLRRGAFGEIWFALDAEAELDREMAEGLPPIGVGGGGGGGGRGGGGGGRGGGGGGRGGGADIGPRMEEMVNVLREISASNTRVFDRLNTINESITRETTQVRTAVVDSLGAINRQGADIFEALGESNRQTEPLQAGINNINEAVRAQTQAINAIFARDGEGSVTIRNLPDLLADLGFGGGGGGPPPVPPVRGGGPPRGVPRGGGGAPRGGGPPVRGGGPPRGVPRGGGGAPRGGGPPGGGGGHPGDGADPPPVVVVPPVAAVPDPVVPAGGGAGPPPVVAVDPPGPPANPLRAPPIIPDREPLPNPPQENRGIADLVFSRSFAQHSNEIKAFLRAQALRIAQEIDQRDVRDVERQIRNRFNLLVPIARRVIEENNLNMPIPRDIHEARETMERLLATNYIGRDAENQLNVRGGRVFTYPGISEREAAFMFLQHRKYRLIFEEPASQEWSPIQVRAMAMTFTLPGNADLRYANRLFILHRNRHHIEDPTADFYNARIHGAMQDENAMILRHFSNLRREAEGAQERRRGVAVRPIPRLPAPPPRPPPVEQPPAPAPVEQPPAPVEQPPAPAPVEPPPAPVEQPPAAVQQPAEQPPAPVQQEPIAVVNVGGVPMVQPEEPAQQQPAANQQPADEPPAIQQAAEQAIQQAVEQAIQQAIQQVVNIPPPPDPADVEEDAPVPVPQNQNQVGNLIMNQVAQVPGMLNRAARGIGNIVGGAIDQARAARRANAAPPAPDPPAQNNEEQQPDQNNALNPPPPEQQREEEQEQQPDQALIIPPRQRAPANENVINPLILLDDAVYPGGPNIRRFTERPDRRDDRFYGRNALFRLMQRVSEQSRQTVNQNLNDTGIASIQQLAPQIRHIMASALEDSVESNMYVLPEHYKNDEQNADFMSRFREGKLDSKDLNEDEIGLMLNAMDRRELVDVRNRFHADVIDKTAEIISETVDFMKSPFGEGLFDLFALEPQRSRLEGISFMESVKNMRHLAFGVGGEGDPSDQYLFKKSMQNMRDTAVSIYNRVKWGFDTPERLTALFNGNRERAAQATQVFKVLNTMAYLAMADPRPTPSELNYKNENEKEQIYENREEGVAIQQQGISEADSETIDKIYFNLFAKLIYNIHSPTDLIATRNDRYSNVIRTESEKILRPQGFLRIFKNNNTKAREIVQRMMFFHEKNNNPITTYENISIPGPINYGNAQGNAHLKELIREHYSATRHQIIQRTNIQEIKFTERVKNVALARLQRNDIDDNTLHALSEAVKRGITPSYTRNIASAADEPVEFAAQVIRGVQVQNQRIQQEQEQVQQQLDRPRIPQPQRAQQQVAAPAPAPAPPQQRQVAAPAPVPPQQRQAPPPQQQQVAAPAPERQPLPPRQQQVAAPAKPRPQAQQNNFQNAVQRFNAQPDAPAPAPMKRVPPKAVQQEGIPPSDIDETYEAISEGIEDATELDTSMVLSNIMLVLNNMNSFAGTSPSLMKEFSKGLQNIQKTNLTPEAKLAITYAMVNVMENNTDEAIMQRGTSEAITVKGLRELSDIAKHYSETRMGLHFNSGNNKSAIRVEYNKRIQEATEKDFLTKRTLELQQLYNEKIIKQPKEAAVILKDITAAQQRLNSILVKNDKFLNVKTANLMESMVSLTANAAYEHDKATANLRRISEYLNTPKKADRESEVFKKINSMYNEMKAKYDQSLRNLKEIQLKIEEELQESSNKMVEEDEKFRQLTSARFLKSKGKEPNYIAKINEQGEKLHKLQEKINSLYTLKANLESTQREENEINFVDDEEAFAVWNTAAENIRHVGDKYMKALTVQNSQQYDFNWGLASAIEGLLIDYNNFEKTSISQNTKELSMHLYEMLKSINEGAKARNLISRGHDFIPSDIPISPQEADQLVRRRSGTIQRQLQLPENLMDRVNQRVAPPQQAPDLDILSNIMDRRPQTKEQPSNKRFKSDAERQIVLFQKIIDTEIPAVKNQISFLTDSVRDVQFFANFNIPNASDPKDLDKSLDYLIANTKNPTAISYLMDTYIQSSNNNITSIMSSLITTGNMKQGDALKMTREILKTYVKTYNNLAKVPDLSFSKTSGGKKDAWMPLGTDKQLAGFMKDKLKQFNLDFQKENYESDDAFNRDIDLLYKEHGNEMIPITLMKLNQSVDLKRIAEKFVKQFIAVKFLQEARTSVDLFYPEPGVKHLVNPTPLVSYVQEIITGDQSNFSNVSYNAELKNTNPALFELNTMALIYASGYGYCQVPEAYIPAVKAARVVMSFYGGSNQERGPYLYSYKPGSSNSKPLIDVLPDEDIIHMYANLQKKYGIDKQKWFTDKIDGIPERAREHLKKAVFPARPGTTTKDIYSSTRSFYGTMTVIGELFENLESTKQQIFNGAILKHINESLASANRGQGIEEVYTMLAAYNETLTMYLEWGKTITSMYDLRKPTTLAANPSFYKNKFTELHVKMIDTQKQRNRGKTFIPKEPNDGVLFATSMLYTSALSLFMTANNDIAGTLFRIYSEASKRTIEKLAKTDNASLAGVNNMKGLNQLIEGNRESAEEPEPPQKAKKSQKRRLQENEEEPPSKKKAVEAPRPIVLDPANLLDARVPKENIGNIVADPPPQVVEQLQPPEINPYEDPGEIGEEYNNPPEPQAEEEEQQQQEQNAIYELNQQQNEGNNRPIQDQNHRNPNLPENLDAQEKMRILRERGFNREEITNILVNGTIEPDPEDDPNYRNPKVPKNIDAREKMAILRSRGFERDEIANILTYGSPDPYEEEAPPKKGKPPAKRKKDDERAWNRNQRRPVRRMPDDN